MQTIQLNNLRVSEQPEKCPSGHITGQLEMNHSRQPTDKYVTIAFLRRVQIFLLTYLNISLHSTVWYCWLETRYGICPTIPI